MTIPCTQEDINATTALQEEAYLSTEAKTAATEANYEEPTEWPFSTKNTGEINVGESIYYTCTDYVKVISKISINLRYVLFDNFCSLSVGIFEQCLEFLGSE